MRKFLGRVTIAIADAMARSTGVWITATASMIAVGGIAAGIGFTQNLEADPRPVLLSNPWFDIGLVLVVLGALLTVATLVVLVVGSSKARTFETLLAQLESEGRDIYVGGSDDQGVILRWGSRTRDVIESALGPAEASLFLSNAGYVFYTTGEESNRVWLDGRLRRLAELIARLSTLHVDLRFRTPRDD